MRCWWCRPSLCMQTDYQQEIHLFASPLDEETGKHEMIILTEASTAWCFKCSPWGHIHIHVLYHISYVVPRPEHMLSRSSMYVNSKEWLVDYNLGVQRAHLKAGPLMKLLYTQFSFSLKSDQVYKRLQVFPLSPKLIRKLTHSEQNPMFVLAKLFLHQINFSFLTKE